MIDGFKKVDKETFKSYVGSYPKELEFDCCQICEPPINAYYDFTLSPDACYDSMAACYIINREFGNDKETIEYFIRQK